MSPDKSRPIARRFRQRTWAALAAALFLSLGCQAPPSEVRLTVLSTNDFHGALTSETKDPESGRLLGGAAALAALLAREKASNPEGTLLLDAGDSFNGTPLSNLTQGRATIDFMNLVGFEATAVGNHGFDWGIPVLRERIEQAEFPFLTANLRDRESGEPPPWAKPYHLLERAGLRIAVIGLTTTGTPRTTLPKNVASLDFLDPAPIANRWIAELVPAKADLAVLLCHLGVRIDPESGRRYGELIEMAERVRGAAALIGGHAHEVYAGEIGGIPLVQAGDSGKYLGRIDLTFDRKERRVKQSEAQILEVFADALPPDSAVAELVSRHRADFEEAMREVIGEAETEIEWRGDRECRMGNLFTDALRQQTGADFVFQNPFGLRASFAAGPITREDVFRVMPFDNTIVLVRMTGSEILELLEQAADSIRLLYTSGLRYAIDTARPAGSRVTLETPLDPDRTYEVSINNFLAQGGDRLSILAGRPEAKELGILLRDALASWIRSETREGRKITAQVDGRIRID